MSTSGDYGATVSVKMPTTPQKSAKLKKNAEATKTPNQSTQKAGSGTNGVSSGWLYALVLTLLVSVASGIYLYLNREKLKLLFNTGTTTVTTVTGPKTSEVQVPAKTSEVQVPAKTSKTAPVKTSKSKAVVPLPSLFSPLTKEEITEGVKHDSRLEPATFRLNLTDTKSEDLGLSPFYQVHPVYIFPENEDSFVSSFIRNSGAWEGDALISMLRLMKKMEKMEKSSESQVQQSQIQKPVLLDIGANVGQFSVAAAAAGYKAVAFEPQRRCWTKLGRTLVENGWFNKLVKVYPVALVGPDFEGSGEFGKEFCELEPGEDTQTNNQGHTSVKKGSSKDLTNKSVSKKPRSSVNKDLLSIRQKSIVSNPDVSSANRLAPAIPFDQLFFDGLLPDSHLALTPSTPLFMKVDVEGFECSILPGFERFMRWHKGLIAIEVEVWSWNQGTCGEMWTEKLKEWHGLARREELGGGGGDQMAWGNVRDVPGSFIEEGVEQNVNQRTKLGRGSVKMLFGNI